MKVIFLLLVSLFVFKAEASKLTATGNGNWNSDATWDSTAPGCYDTIHIPSGITVTITGHEDYESCDPMIIIIDGTLQFQSGKKIKLPCDSAVLIRAGGQLKGGGGGGNSNNIEICGDVVWRSGDGDLSGYTLLPIELVSFKASMAKRGVKVTWITESELNNDFFEIQHSVNGVDWTTIAKVNGAGNSSAELKYEFHHENANLGGNYYRMIQVDFDGAKKLYPAIFINNNTVENNSDLYIFPNPSTTTQRTIYYSNTQKDNVVMNVFDLSGKQVSSNSYSTTNTGYIVVNFDNIPGPGVYIIEIEGIYSRIVFL